MALIEKTYYYKVFGISISSPIVLEELIETNELHEPVITIQLQRLSRPSVDDITIKHYPIVSIKKGYFFLELKDIANFQVEKTNLTTLVIIDVLDVELNFTILAFLYGSVLTVALQMNSIFALHASAISHNGRLSLFSGRSGIGKSTLAAQLHTKGYGLFSDDKCVLTWSKEDACYLAEPSIQIIRLWQDALSNLNNQDFLGNKNDIVDRVNKYQFILNNESIMKDPQHISSINIIRNVTEDRVLRVKSITGMKKLKLLKEQTHRVSYLNDLDQQRKHWDYIQHLSQNLSVNVISRPINTSIEVFTDFIENQVVLKGMDS